MFLTSRTTSAKLPLVRCPLVQFSHSVMSNSLQPNGLQHTRPPCPSPTPRAYSNSCLLSRWYHPTISSSVVSFSSHLQSFPASGSFPMSQFFASGGQSIGVSASASVLPVNTQDWSPSRWTGWISLQSKGLSRVCSNTTVQKHQFFGSQLCLLSNFHIHSWRPLGNKQTYIHLSDSGLCGKMNRTTGNKLESEEKWAPISLSTVLVSTKDTGMEKRTRASILGTAISWMIAHKLHIGTGFQLQLQNDGARLDDLSFL